MSPTQKYNFLVRYSGQWTWTTYFTFRDRAYIGYTFDQAIELASADVKKGVTKPSK